MLDTLDLVRGSAGSSGCCLLIVMTSASNGVIRNPTSHPLARPSIMDGIRLERQALSPLRDRADLVIEPPS